MSDFRESRDRLAARITRCGSPGGHAGIHYTLAALLVACVAVAGAIVFGATPHTTLDELSGSNHGAKVAMPLGPAVPVLSGHLPKV